MAFWFQCPVCKSKRLATEGIIGKRVRCADCNNFVEVTRAASSNDVDPDEVDRLVDQLISEESVVDSEDVDIADVEVEGDEVELISGEPAKRSRFKDGPIGDLDEEPADVDEAESMDAMPLKSSRFADDDDAFDVEVVETGEAGDGFALKAPSEEIADLVDASGESGDLGEPEVEVVGFESQYAADERQLAKKELEWKTEATEEDDEWVDPPLLGNKKEREDSEMDMTPMVDVTFLLLIFFMVTASFILQKSMNRPTESVEDPSLTVQEDLEDSEDIVQIDIAADNTYYITLPEEEQIEAPSEQDLRIALANTKQGGNTGIVPTKMLIRAHEESFHGRVITAMDIGADLDLALQVQITSDDL